MKKIGKWPYVRREVVFTILTHSRVHPSNPGMKKAMQVFKWCPVCDTFHVLYSCKGRRIAHPLHTGRPRNHNPILGTDRDFVLLQ